MEISNPTFLDSRKRPAVFALNLAIPDMRTFDIRSVFRARNHHADHAQLLPQVMGEGFVIQPVSPGVFDKLPYQLCTVGSRLLIHAGARGNSCKGKGCATPKISPPTFQAVDWIPISSSQTDPAPSRSVSA